ncbi:hypothetical protein [Phocaeicola coprophilus]|uniref:hypothetical protein n=1 Tax=Phocaeicola coprophilus TaxID=387090 RepID=UPI00266CDE76|nr:hypothetical protein [Phocaeicola coprophilus]
MRKKFIAVYALMAVLALGSTTLTSCVDDNESASVTAIRDAKAKQLTALANYQDVKAQNEKIIAEADAAIRNAEAKAKEIQNELSGLALEKQKATLETDIETAKLKAEEALLRQKASLEQAKASLIEAADAADNATKERINNLLEKADALMNGEWTRVWNENKQDYEWIYITYNSIYGKDGLNDRLLQKKADRVKADYELVDIKLQIAEAVRKEEKKLAVNEALLAEYQKYDNTDLDAAEKAYNEASQKLPALQKLYNEANDLYLTEVNEKVNPALNDIDKTELMLYINGDPNGYRVSAYISYEPREAETITINHDDGTAERYTPSYTQYQIVVNEEDLAAAVTNVDSNAKIAGQKLKDAEKAQADGLKDDAITLDGVTTYKELKTAVADAKKAFDKNPTEENKLAWVNADEKLTEYEKSLQKKVDDAQEKLDIANEEVEIINEINKLLTGDAFKAYTAKYEAYIAAVDAAAETLIAAMKAEHNLQVQNELADGLKSVVDAHTDWLALINQTEQAINDNKKNIATMTADDGQTTEAIKQQYIAILDQEIARLEKEIAIKQAQYDGYMTQIEALINGDTGTEEPETPEEGGEETPAE